MNVRGSKFSELLKLHPQPFILWPQPTINNNIPDSGPYL